MNDSITPLNAPGNWTAHDALASAMGTVGADECVVIATRSPEGRIVVYFGGEEMTDERGIYLADHIMRRCRD